MRKRKLIDFLVYPKFFSSLAIPYKGRYYLKIRIYQQKQMNKKITYAFPKLLETQTQPKCFLTESKAKIINQQIPTYESETIILLYSQQKILLNSYCIFTLQYDTSRQFKTWIEFQLLTKPLQRNSTVQSNCEEKPQQSVCKQVLLINQLSLHRFQKIFFKHIEYYCALDVYIATINLGCRIRNSKIQLAQFQRKHKNKQKKQSTSKSSLKSQNQCLYLPDPCQLVEDIKTQLKEYKRIRKVYLGFEHQIKNKKSFLYQSHENMFSMIPDLENVCYDSLNASQIKTKQQILELYQEFLLINRNIIFVFQNLPQLIKILPYSIFKAHIKASLNQKFKLKQKYLVKRIKFQKDQLLVNQSLNFALIDSKNLNQINQKTFRKIQKNDFIKIRRDNFIKKCQIVNQKDFYFPMILQETDLKTDQIELKQKNEDFSLIVLIHGYQGSHYDLQKVKNFLKYLCKNFKLLAINSIQKQINENIQFLGEKVANQIKFYIKHTVQQFKFINFIGFSLGGVLARACLKHLQQFKCKMNLLITLSSPHLGVSQSTNSFVNLGVWYLAKIDKVKNIKELNFQSVTQKQSYLMKLSQQQSLSWFKKVVLISSKEDQFVPYYSARVSPTTKNEYINQMARNILKNIITLQRIQVWFDVDSVGTLDKLIGRTAHIELIDNFNFLELLCLIYYNQF